MNTGDRNSLFNKWASSYDNSVSSKDSVFPFLGYNEVLGEVYRASNALAGMRVLELGVGTGNLTALYVAQGCIVTDIDFSEEMLQRSGKRFPQMKAMHADLLSQWWKPLHKRFDLVVSAYVLHEFSLDAKMKIIRDVFTHSLSNRGSLVIADVSFPDANARVAAASYFESHWDSEEFYWAADETRQACLACDLTFVYRQVSPCAGVYFFEQCAVG